MYWFFIALGAPILWAMVNIADQYLVSHYTEGEQGSAGLVIFTSLIGIFVALAILLCSHSIFMVPMLDRVLLIATGIFTIGWFILYLFALEIEDVSIVASWFLTVPIFGFIFSYVFLGEMLTLHQILGSLIVLIGVGIISFDFTKEKKRAFKWKPALYMTLSCIIIALSGVIFKYVTVEDNFWQSSFWEYVGVGLAGVILYVAVPAYRKEFLSMLRLGGMKIFFLNFGIEISTILGNMLTNFAVLLAPVTMVYLVGSFQPAMVLTLTLFCTRFFPSIAKEDMSSRILVPKIVAIGIMLAGSVILFI